MQHRERDAERKIKKGRRADGRRARTNNRKREGRHQEGKEMKWRGGERGQKRT